jgi:Tol biopolymer transport system component
MLYTYKSKRPSGLGVTAPIWSPDGQRIALIDDIVFVTIDVERGTVLENQFSLLDNLGLPCCLAWSPYDDRIVFVNQASNTLCMFRVSSLRIRTLTEGTTPIWSPDSDSIYFIHRDSMFLISAFGGSPQFLASAGNNHKSISRSPSGKQLAFIGPGNWISLIDRRGESVRRLAHPDWYGWGDSVSWSPIYEDQIAISQTADISRTFILRTDGSVIQQVDNLSQASWSFDGKELLGWHDGRGNIDIWVVDVETGSRTNVGTGIYASWSPTERKICFTSERSVYVMSI